MSPDVIRSIRNSVAFRNGNILLKELKQNARTAHKNSVHWVLEVALQEDGCRIRKDQAPRHMATLRPMALNLLRQADDENGLKARRLRAGWDSDYLLQV